MRISFFFLGCLFAITVSAEQAVINDYDDTRDNYIYDQPYVGNTGE